jgi:hypothetical protein
MDDTAILVVSCDDYSDLWGPFFHIFRKNWPDCPYSIFLGANHKGFEAPFVKTIRVGDDRNWGENLLLMLEQLNSRRVLMFLDDFFLTLPVNTEEVEGMVSTAEENGLGCLRLRPSPPPSRRLFQFENIGLLRKGDDYRVSTQVAIWDVQVLSELARPAFSPWDFEIYGTILSERLDREFWGVYEPVIHYQHAVERGRWMSLGLDICQRWGVQPDLCTRGIITDSERETQRKSLDRRLKRIAKRVIPSLFWRYIQRQIRLIQIRKLEKKRRSTSPR